MADTVQITAGSGTVIGTDEVTIGGTAQHVQRVKLVDGTDGGTDLLPGSATYGLAVNNRRQIIAISATPTISSSPAYTAGDNIGGEITLANAVRASGGYAAVRGWRLANKAANSPAITAFIASQQISANSGSGKTDNAAFDPDDADLAYLQGSFAMGASWSSFSDNQLSAAGDLYIPFTATTTTAYLYLVTTGTPTMTSTSDLTVTLFIEYLT